MHRTSRPVSVHLRDNAAERWRTSVPVASGRRGRELQALAFDQRAVGAERVHAWRSHGFHGPSQLRFLLLKAGASRVLHLEAVQSDGVRRRRPARGGPP